MAEKLNFLKKYPLIPSVFFILFAWFCLHLISAFKNTEKTIQTLLKTTWFNSNDLKVKGLEEKKWTLEIKGQDIRFESEDFGKVNFNSTQLTELYKSPENQVQVWRANDGKNTIEVFVKKDFKHQLLDVYINFNGKSFYQRSE